MADLTWYRGLQVLDSDTPPGEGGAAIQFDLKQLVDWSPKTVWNEDDAPDTVNNASEDFHAGSLWLQTSTSPPKLFVCQSSTTSSAVWLQVMTEIKIVNDTAPQLGGNLDVNGKTITSASGAVVLNPASGRVFLGSTQTSNARGLHLNIEKDGPGIVLYDTKTYSPPLDPPTDFRAWEVFASQAKLFFRLLSDNVSTATTWLEVQRNGMDVHLIRITGLTQVDGPLYHNQTYCDNANYPDPGTGYVDFDLASSDMFATTLTGSRTLRLNNIHVGQRFNLTLTQGGSGSHTVTWWDGIQWPGGTVPTLTTAAGRSDVFEFLAKPSSTFIGRVWGQNFV